MTSTIEDTWPVETLEDGIWFDDYTSLCADQTNPDGMRKKEDDSLADLDRRQLPSVERGEDSKEDDILGMKEDDWGEEEPEDILWFTQQMEDINVRNILDIEKDPPSPSYPALTDN